MNTNWTNIAKWLLSVPAITAGVDFISKEQIWNTIWQVIWTTDSILNVWNSLLNPLFTSVAWWASAWLLTNSFLKDLWVEKKWIRYTLNWVATLAWYAWWTTLAPYLVAGGLSYAIWKHWWKYGKEALNRVAWTAWWLTWWAVAWWVRSAWKGLKWEQFWGEWINKINPKF